jgi:mono/diheme cytochrome c family protein
MSPDRVFTSVVRVALVAVGAAAALAATSPPSASQPAAPSAGATPAPAGDQAAKFAKGHQLFDNYGCGGCHSLADAGATGHVGPSFDGDPNLSESFVVNRVTNGQGQMPAFNGQMSPEEIAAVAAYVIHAASK